MITVGDYLNGFTCCAFNGEVFTLDNININSILVAQSWISGSAIVTFDATHIYVDFENIGQFGPGNYVAIEVNSVPEPGSMMLLGSGLIGLAGTLRRKLIA